MTFAENLATLAPAEHLAGIELRDPDGETAVIENKPGSQGSLKVYQHLLRKYGRIDARAAAEGIALYAEHTEDARENPGKHPNIDRLLRVLATGAVYEGRLIPA